MDLPFYREYELPWTSSADQEQKFKRLLAWVLGISFFLGAVWPFLPSPEQDPYEVIEIPPRIAQLLLEEEPLPPPPPPEPEPEEEPEPEPEIDQTQVAREQAQQRMDWDLSDFVDNDLLETVNDDRELTANTGAADRNTRNMIGGNVGTSSGGINTADLSRNTGGTQIAGRNTTQVDSALDDIAPSAGGATREGTSGRASRSREEIELEFDRQKGAIFALYNRALRQNPALEGQLVLRITIAPTGEVTACEIVSSELGDPELEARLVQRVMMFRFESRDVEPITTTKPIDFFPA